MFDDRYELLELLGSGRFGEVWRAHDRNRDLTVALKVLNSGTSTDAAWREATNLTRLSSPYILKVNNASSLVDVPYIDTELAPGGPVSVAVRLNGVAPFRAVRWTRQLCTAVNLCHARGILHRDIRPENIFRSPTDEVQLGDFGAAAVMDANGEASPFGHRDAKAPEVWWSANTSVRSEVWSIGATVFRMLSGHAPARDGAGKVSEDIRVACPHISAALARVVRTALESDPADRWPTVAVLDERLATLKRKSRDFCRVLPHSGHERCWLGSAVKGVADVFVCVEPAQRRARVFATYKATGRRVASEHDQTVTRARVDASLRKTFDALR